MAANLLPISVFIVFAVATVSAQSNETTCYICVYDGETKPAALDTVIEASIQNNEFQVALNTSDQCSVLTEKLCPMDTYCGVMKGNDNEDFVATGCLSNAVCPTEPGTKNGASVQVPNSFTDVDVAKDLCCAEYECQSHASAFSFSLFAIVLPIAFSLYFAKEQSG